MKKSNAHTFPKYHSNKHHEKTGLRMVAEIVEGDFGWSFRETDLADDFGIDAFADCVVDGNVTGKCLALQIKCGASYRKAEGEDGFYFVGQRKHINYYRNMASPVMIIVCDDKAKKAWWFRFDHEAIEAAGEHWKMFIPWRQIFDASVKKSWLDAAGPSLDYTDEMQFKWSLDSMLRRHKLIWLIIDRADVERLDVSYYKGFFERCTKNRSLRMELCGKVMFSIYGYDDDPRELWEIPDVRAWMAIAEPQIKYWIWFTSLNPKVGSIHLLQYCVLLVHRRSLEPKNGGVAIQIGKEDRKSFLERHFGWLNELCEQYGIPERLNRKVSANFHRYLHSKLIDEEGVPIEI